MNGSTLLVNNHADNFEWSSNYFIKSVVKTIQECSYKLSFSIIISPEQSFVCNCVMMRVSELKICFKILCTTQELLLPWGSSSSSIARPSSGSASRLILSSRHHQEKNKRDNIHPLVMKEKRKTHKKIFNIFVSGLKCNMTVPLRSQWLGAGQLQAFGLIGKFSQANHFQFHPSLLSFCPTSTTYCFLQMTFHYEGEMRLKEQERVKQAEWVMNISEHEAIITC